MRVKLDPGAYLPERAHKNDAGFDLRARENWYLGPGEHHAFDTGVHMEIPPGHAGVLIAKSGLNVRHGLTSTGLVDAGYTGSIVVSLQNNSGNGYMIREGDKISQVVLIPIYTPELELVSYLDDTERGSNGFGSTGR